MRHYDLSQGQEKKDGAVREELSFPKGSHTVVGRTSEESRIIINLTLL